MNNITLGNDKRISIVEFLVWVIFMCIYILPSAETSTGISIVKYFFLFCMLLIYLLLMKKVYVDEILFIFLIFLAALMTSSFNVLSLLGIVVLEKMLRYGKKEDIKKVLLKTKLIWLAMIATVFYSVIYKSDGIYIHTAVREINESGLSILCLGLIIKKKNKYLGMLVLLLGLVILSRNYILALMIIILFSTKPFRQLVNRFKLERHINFVSILIVSSLILVSIGLFYQNLFTEGKIVNQYMGAEKLFNFFDRSNYFRFTVNIYNIEMYLKHPDLLLSGVQNIDQYKQYAYEIANENGQLYVGNTPHNFVFSYLRLYGLFAIPALLFISRIMKMLVTKNNFKIFLSIMCYAIFMSAGFNTYWLFLTAFVLIVYE